jgi:hypothetical protein
MFHINKDSLPNGDEYSLLRNIADSAKNKKQKTKTKTKTKTI